MSDNAKKGVLVGVIVLALILAGFGASRMSSSDKPEVVKHISMPPGFKSEREKDLEELAKKQGGNGPAAAPAAGGGEPDLGGDLRGK